MRKVVTGFMFVVLFTTLLALFDRAMKEDAKSLCEHNASALQSCGKLQYD